LNFQTKPLDFVVIACRKMQRRYLKTSCNYFHYQLGDALTDELIEALTDELKLALIEELGVELMLALGEALVELLAAARSRSWRILKCSTREKPSNFPLIAPEASAKMRIPCPVSQGKGIKNR